MWAVGQKFPSGGRSDDYRPLIRHWDGTVWRTVPTGQQAGGRLLSVAVVSADDAWAVGETYKSGSEWTQVLALHWDGSAWSQVTIPTFPGIHNFLTDVSFTSATNGIAAGLYYSGEDVTPISLHWNGSTWKSAVGPNRSIVDVDGLSPKDAWGVGATSDFQKPYAAHWDGTSWTQTPTPGAGVLRSVVQSQDATQPHWRP